MMGFWSLLKIKAIVQINWCTYGGLVCYFYNKRFCSDTVGITKCRLNTYVKCLFALVIIAR